MGISKIIRHNDYQRCCFGTQADETEEKIKGKSQRVILKEQALYVYSYNWTMDEDNYRPQLIIVICTYLLRANPWTTDVNRFKQIHNILDSVCQACNFLLCTYTSWSLLLYCYPDFSAQVIKIMRRCNHSFSLGWHLYQSWGSRYNRKEKPSSKRSKFSILTSSSLQILKRMQFVMISLYPNVQTVILRRFPAVFCVFLEIQLGGEVKRPLGKEMVCGPARGKCSRIFTTREDDRGSI